MNSISRGFRRRARGATLRAATSEAALATAERAETLVARVREAQANEGEDEGVLEPEGHYLGMKSSATLMRAPGLDSSSIDCPDATIVGGG
jgi:hypothetical protein